MQGREASCADHLLRGPWEDNGGLWRQHCPVGKRCPLSHGLPSRSRSHWNKQDLPSACGGLGLRSGPSLTVYITVNLLPYSRWRLELAQDPRTALSRPTRSLF